MTSCGDEMVDTLRTLPRGQLNEGKKRIIQTIFFNTNMTPTTRRGLFPFCNNNDNAHAFEGACKRGLQVFFIPPGEGLESTHQPSQDRENHWEKVK